MANSQPQPIDTAISARCHTLRNATSSSASISTTAMVTDSMLSRFICCELPTAITGPPKKRMSMLLPCLAVALWAAVCKNFRSFALFSVSLEP